MHEGVWTVKCRRGSAVRLCVRATRVLKFVCQSVSQLGCCCLTMAVLSADVLRWHVSFYISFILKNIIYINLFLCISFFLFKEKSQFEETGIVILFMGYFPHRL